MRIEKDLNEIIRERRENMGLTLEELAEMAEMSAKGIEKIELGKSNPKWQSVLNISKALKIDLGEFYNPDKENKNDDADMNSVT